MDTEKEKSIVIWGRNQKTFYDYLEAEDFGLALDREFKIMVNGQILYESVLRPGFEQIEEGEE